MSARSSADFSVVRESPSVARSRAASDEAPGEEAQGLSRRGCWCRYSLGQRPSLRTDDRSSSATPLLSSGGRLCLAIGQQGANVLNREARIGAVKPDRRIVVFRQYRMNDWTSFATGGGGAPLTLRKESIEDERGLCREVQNVPSQKAIEDGEEAQAIVLKRHPMGEMQRPDSIRRLTSLLSTRAFPNSFKTRPCTRDSKVMYVSKGACEVIAGNARRAATALMS